MPNAVQLTKNQLLHDATHEYLSNLDKNNLPEPHIIESELLSEINKRIDMRNATEYANLPTDPDTGKKIGKPSYWQRLTELNSIIIAEIIANTLDIAKIATSASNISPDYDILAIYINDPDDANYGTYVTSDDDFRKIARRYNYQLDSKQFSETMIALRDLVPRKYRCTDKNLIAVNNGIFDYQTKKLQPFSPDYVFLVKSHVNYIDNPTNPTITMPNGDAWNVDTWINDLSDDPEIVALIWEILGAIIRPNVRWNKSAWFYSETGNNGKGTLCELMRQLCGDGAHTSIQLNQFSKDFALEPLTRASAIIVDENDVGTYIDKASNLKAVITNDVININRKYKNPIAYQFFGFMVQCLNEFPRIKDKSNSFYRRQLFIPFDKCFTGKEITEIKKDYLHRPEVLEYVLHKVLNIDYYQLSEPTACKTILEEYKEFNDPIRQFWSFLKPVAQWDLLPFSFLHTLYKAWLNENVPEGKPLSSQKFIADLLTLLNEDKDWYCSDKTMQVRSSGKMDKPEPLILRYNLQQWKKENYTGSDANVICSPTLKDRYRGIQRYK